MSSYSSSCSTSQSTLPVPFVPIYNLVTLHSIYCPHQSTSVHLSYLDSDYYSVSVLDTPVHVLCHSSPRTNRRAFGTQDSVFNQGPSHLDQEIDILRIVKMQHANSTAACIIQRHPADPFTSEIETRGVLRTYEEVDCSTIETLIRHCDPQWQADVATGKVEQIWVSALGHRHGPTVEFRVDDEDVARHLKDPHIPKMTAESYYFERTKMDGVRKCQVEGDEYAMYFHLTHVSMPR